MLTRRLPYTGVTLQSAGIADETNNAVRVVCRASCDAFDRRRRLDSRFKWRA